MASNIEQRQGRRGIPSIRRRAAKARKAVVTLGDVIAAAFDAVGGEASEAAGLLTSRSMSKAIGRRIVLVPGV